MKYLVLDTETGGLDPASNALMSMGAILLDEELRELSVHYAVFRNELKREVGRRSKEINGLDEARLELALSPSEFKPVWDLLSSKADVIVGHNVFFDTSFLLENGFECATDKTLDTMHVAWDVWGSQKAGLTICYERIGKRPKNAHNALYDCQMVASLLRWFVSMNFLRLPLPYYPVVPDFYEKGAFGYVKMKALGLL